MENKKIKLWKKFLIIILILCIILILFIGRKFIIIKNLVTTSTQYTNKTNYFAVVQTLQGGTVNILKSYNKDGNYLTTINTYGKDFDDTRSLVKYKKNDEQIGIIQSGKEKVALLDNTSIGEINVVNMLSTFNNTMQQLQFAMTSKITTDSSNNMDCYLIELNNWKIWVSKDSGLIVREINGSFITERFYVFDTVKDDDIKKPDISDCKMP